MAANEDFRAARATAHNDPYMDEPEEEELFDDEQPPRRSSRVLPIVVASLAILGFVVIVYYAYQQGIRAGSEQNPPVIKADEGPTKVRPAQPGGMDVPNQDKKIYEIGKPQSQQAGAGVERLLPKAEEPMQRPPVPPPQATPPRAPAADQTVAAPSLPGVVASPTLPVTAAPVANGQSAPAASGLGAATAPGAAGTATSSGGLPPLSMITGNPLPTTNGVNTPPPPPLPTGNAPLLSQSTDATAATARAAGVPAPPPPAAPPRDGGIAVAPAPTTPAPATRGGIALGGAKPALPAPAAPTPTQQAAAPAAVPPIATAASQAAPATGGAGAFAVQIMAGKTQEEAEAAWRRISASHKDLLGSLSHDIQVHQDARGTFYRLRAVPFASREDADSLCSALKTRGLQCLVPK